MSLHINESTVDVEGPCRNRSLSAANDSGASPDCHPDDEWRWSDGDSDLKELFKNICLGLVLVAACLLTIVGNILVLHAVRTERKLQTVRTQPLKTNMPGFWTRERVPNGYDRCSCCWGCCRQIFNVLKLFHFATDLNHNSATDC